MRRSNAVSAPSGQSSRRRVAGSAASSRPLWRQRRGEAAARAPLASAPPTLRSRLPAPEASRRALPGAGSGCHVAEASGLVAVLGVPQQLGEHPQAGDAVREAVVDADHERGAAVGERAGDVYRTRAVACDRGARPSPLRPAASAGRGRSPAPGSGADVVADVELRVVDPGRGGEPQAGSAPGAAGRGAGPPAAPRPGRARARPSAARRRGAGSTIASFSVWPAIASDSSRRMRVSSALSRSKRLKFARWRGARAAPTGPHFDGYGTYKVMRVQAQSAFAARASSCSRRRHRRCCCRRHRLRSCSPAGSSPSALSPLGRSAYHSAPN